MFGDNVGSLGLVVEQKGDHVGQAKSQCQFKTGFAQQSLWGKQCVGSGDNSLVEKREFKVAALHI